MSALAFFVQWLEFDAKILSTLKDLTNWVTGKEVVMERK